MAKFPQNLGLDRSFINYKISKASIGHRMTVIFFNFNSALSSSTIVGSLQLLQTMIKPFYRDINTYVQYLGSPVIGVGRKVL
jgi:hypothetical protein